MNRTILRTQDDIKAYAKEYFREGVSFGNLTVSEKAHYDVYQFANDNSAREVKQFARYCSSLYREKSATRAKVYEWYADHIQPE